MIQKTAKFGVFALPSLSTASNTTPTTGGSVGTARTAPIDDKNKHINTKMASCSSKKSHPGLDLPSTMPVLTALADCGQPLVDLHTLTRPEDVFSALYSHYTSEQTYSISLQERKYINADKTNPLYKANSLTYGEINDVQCLRHVFGYLEEHQLMSRESRESVFYDLGSGSGRVVIAAALLFPFARCCGIEILTSLHGIAEMIKDEYQRFFASPVIEVYHGSITDLALKDWTDGDIIYVNSVCFSNELFAETAQHASKMKIGSIMITLAQPLPKSSGFKLLHETREQMSWGEADFLIQQKVK